MDQLDRCLCDALLRLDIRIAMLAYLDHMAVLTDAYSAAVRALELALLFECTEILADAVLGDLELLAEVAHTDLAVTSQHAQNNILTFFQKHTYHSYKHQFYCFILLYDYFTRYDKIYQVSSPRICSTSPKVRVNQL